MTDVRAQHRNQIYEGMQVMYVKNEDDNNETWNEGVVEHILTPENVEYSPHGIKIRLVDGTIGYARQLLSFDEISPERLSQMIQEGESTTLEFKHTFKVDVLNNKEEKCLRDESVKEIAAFMNTKGGRLIIGVDDSNQIVGLKSDYDFVETERVTQTKQDKFKQEIRNYVKSKLNDHTLESNYNITFATIEKKEICIIHVIESTAPVFVNQDIKYTKCMEPKLLPGVRNNYYIRTDSGTQMLDRRDMIVWINKRKQNSRI